jgi:hypothetical protein
MHVDKSRLRVASESLILAALLIAATGCVPDPVLRGNGQVGV